MQDYFALYFFWVAGWYQHKTLLTQLKTQQIQLIPKEIPQLIPQLRHHFIHQWMKVTTRKKNNFHQEWMRWVTMKKTYLVPQTTQKVMSPCLILMQRTTATQVQAGSKATSH